MTVIFLRGFVIVTWVSLNVYNISSGAYGWAFLSGTMVSVVWWFNARTATTETRPLGALLYGLGAGCGTVTGMWLGHLLGG